MTRIRVVTDTAEYRRQLKASGPGRYHRITDAELKALESGAYILTGDKTREFGGGPSPGGFVIQGKELVGRVRLAGRLVNDGFLTL
jgi:hypothetical protein